MTTEQVLEIVKERELRLFLKDGNPVIDRNGAGEHGKKITDALLSVLKIHRERIIEILKKQERAT
jgi:hypothetical protein